MDETSPIRRIIACVDSADFDLEGKLAGSQSGNGTNANQSNIYRLQNALSNNVCYDDQGRQIIQNVRYYRAAGDGAGFVDKLKNRVSGEATEQQIKDLTRDICQQLVDPHDEIYLFGFGKGAYVVRAVAGMFHHMGIPEINTSDFDELYQYAIDLIKARKEEDSRKGGKALEYIRAHTRGEANIQLVGVFDTIRSAGDKNVHDLSFVPSIRNFRHALALNETRTAFTLEMPETPTRKKIEERTFVQAWFLGSHADLGGGMQHDGLSLYPLQWMLLEAMNHGLVFERGKPIRGTNGQKSTLALTFPQFAGDVPQLKASEKIEWIVQYVNGLEVTMFDLQPVHSEDTVEHDNHVIHFAVSSSMVGSIRRISREKRLLGWTEDGPYGTIMHPSVFCLLDRNPRLWEQSKLKPYKEDIANFQYVGLQDFSANLPPWLEGSELSASGVKAFRILVCGKTGVGKSTLINRVFGVQMTEESNTYDQGNHDINQAFESASHPGLLIHDSRGWQAGSDQELVLIAKFLRHRAFQKDPAEALHVIWFCIDSDVSRIEEADKKTFETIAQYSHNVPVFVIGTKKDKLIAYRKIELLEKYMQSTNDYQEARSLADQEADKLSEDQFMLLRDQLSQIKNYKADGYCCLSKDDDKGVRSLLSQTIDLIADERVRLFCVAAQVVDVDKKIDSAITESMRLGVHAIRTAMVPLPFSGMIGTPTVSRILCEHVMQCFGFPKALPAAVDEIMSRVVLGNLKGFMAVSLTHFLVVSSATIGLTAGTFGIGALLGGVGCILATPPTARMLLKCAADMILILERSFRYGGKYVSTKQIEDAAQRYVVVMTTTFSGKEKLLQTHVHDEIDKLVPLKNVHIGFKFSKLRTNLEEIIYANRYDRSTHPPQYEQFDPRIKNNAAEIATSANVPELGSQAKEIAELDNTQAPTIAELPGDTKRPSEMPSPDTMTTTTSPIAGPIPNTNSASSIVNSWTSSTTSTVSRAPSGDETPSPRDGPPDSSRSMLKSLRKFSLRKTKTNE